MDVHVYPFLPSFQLGLAVCAAVSLCYGLLLVTYNLFFHPLSGFPGPRSAACTRWWLAYMELVKHVSISDLRAELHRKYGKASQSLYDLLIFMLILTAGLGDVVRISPNEVGALFRCGRLKTNSLMPRVLLRSAPLCQPGRIQRYLQCAEQVG